MRALINRRLRLGALALVAAAFTAACDGTPTGQSAVDGKAHLDRLMAVQFARPSFDSPHKEPSGFQFVRTDNNGQLYVYRDGQPAGTLALSAGTSYPVRVLFYDGRGRTLNVCSETDHDVEVTVANTAIASYAKASRCTGSLVAGSAGGTTFQVVLEHLTTAGWHADWSSPWLNVTVS
jgi:hypothetical protein